MKSSKLYVLIGVAVALALLVSACQAETVAYPSNILFLGNAIIGENGGVQTHLRNLAAENETLPDTEVATTYQAYTSIGQLWTKSENKFAKENFNYVVVFETFQNIWNDGAGKEDFFADVRRIQSEAKEGGAETVLLMGWGYGEYDVFTQDIADAHAEIGAELGIKVAPVGLAFEAALSERPDYELFTDRNIFLNHRATYLATLVLYATIYEENPAGLTYQLGEIWEQMEGFAYRAREWELTTDELSFLQRIAWETVTSYPLSGVTE